MKKKDYPIQMILNDWASGSTQGEIAKTYGFASDRAAADWISKRRKEGYDFEIRKPGRRTKWRITL